MGAPKPAPVAAVTSGAGQARRLAAGFQWEPSLTPGGASVLVGQAGWVSGEVGLWCGRGCCRAVILVGGRAHWCHAHLPTGHGCRPVRR